MAALIVASIATQVADAIDHEVFEPSAYFAYFTVQTNVMNVVALLLGGALLLRRRPEPGLFTSARMATVAYAAVTGVVYAVLLRGTGVPAYEAVPWPNEVLHVMAPLFILLDWLFAPGRTAVPWRGLWLVVVYPLVWLGFTVGRGVLSGWYPYPFLVPGESGGWGGVALYVLGIALFVIGVASAAIVLSRSDRRVRRRGSR
ncbi:Pr6Pr family membrane protein [Planctomonas psychrotolerans]|uniref:Pr6Pr family membrane protein n=1 Tax=Planctomonas psychrotolerans TaxID=2528712 RepID=UPI00123B2FEB|nr:Pr6Pr family membrane protein [Planctomonas psychrotolerans]